MKNREKWMHQLVIWNDVCDLSFKFLRLFYGRPFDERAHLFYVDFD